MSFQKDRHAHDDFGCIHQVTLETQCKSHKGQGLNVWHLYAFFGTVGENPNSPYAYVFRQSREVTHSKGNLSYLLVEKCKSLFPSSDLLFPSFRTSDFLFLISYFRLRSYWHSSGVYSDTQELSVGTFTALITGLFVCHPTPCFWWKAPLPRLGEQQDGIFAEGSQPRLFGHMFCEFQYLSLLPSFASNGWHAPNEVVSLRSQGISSRDYPGLTSGKHQSHPNLSRHSCHPALCPSHLKGYSITLKVLTRVYQWLSI